MLYRSTHMASVGVKGLLLSKSTLPLYSPTPSSPLADRRYKILLSGRGQTDSDLVVKGHMTLVRDLAMGLLFSTRCLGKGSTFSLYCRVKTCTQCDAEKYTFINFHDKFVVPFSDKFLTKYSVDLTPF